MLRPLVFAPCEKIIVSQEDNTPSLITLLETINIAIPLGAEIPDDAMVPFRWFIFTLWCSDTETPGVTFQYDQRIRLVASDGRQAIDNDLHFTVPAGSRTHRTTVLVPGFPVIAPGIARMTLSLREGEGPWEEIQTFPLWVNRTA